MRGMKMNQSTIWIVFGIVALITASVLVWVIGSFEPKVAKVVVPEKKTVQENSKRGNSNTDDVPTIDNSTKIDTTNWLIYQSDKHGFELRYPKGFNFDSTTDLGNVGYFFHSDSARIAIFPQGGFGFGLPHEKPKTNYLATQDKTYFNKVWTVKDGNLLIITTIEKYPSSWTDEHYIMFSGDSDAADYYYGLLDSLALN